jgi:hypothetical protein
MRKWLILGIVGAVLIAGDFGAGLLMRLPRPERLRPWNFPEQFGHVRSCDDIVSAGVMFSASQTQLKRVAVVTGTG